MIGSHNFDPRSDDYNTESGFIIHDADGRRARTRGRAARHRAAERMGHRQAPAAEVRRDASTTRSSDFSTALPLFDFWPFRYASSFELKPGCQPLPPSDPQFYECYEDVGDFPEVDLPMKTIYTRMVTAFGAGLVGIL